MGVHVRDYMVEKDKKSDTIMCVQFVFVRASSVLKGIRTYGPSD